MATTVTFQVLEGVDKGRIFRDLSAPLTIGREEGNLLRLNDERVSRFHAKVQQDGEDVVLTDLESTNGTRVNGNVVQIRRLRVGDRICLGRSLLLFGSNEEIAARMASMREPAANSVPEESGFHSEGPATLRQTSLPSNFEQDYDFEVNVKDPVTASEGKLFIGDRALPPLPQKLTPAQAARAAEIFDFLHRGLSAATENVRADEDGTEVKLSFAEWQKVLAVHMLLARYLRAISEPDSLQH